MSVAAQYLEDNESLIQTINEGITLGRFEDAAKYQAQLQRNLMWLAAIADAPTTGAVPPQVTSALQPYALINCLLIKRLKLLKVPLCLPLYPCSASLALLGASPG